MRLFVFSVVFYIGSLAHAQFFIPKGLRLKSEMSCLQCGNSFFGPQRMWASKTFECIHCGLSIRESKVGGKLP